MNTSRVWQASDTCICGVKVFVSCAESPFPPLFDLLLLSGALNNWIATSKPNFYAWDTYFLTIRPQRNLTIPSDPAVRSHRLQSSGQAKLRQVALCLEFSKQHLFHNLPWSRFFLYKMWLSSDAASTACILWRSHLFVSDKAGRGEEKRGEGAAWTHLHFKRGAREVLRAYRA